MALPSISAKEYANYLVENAEGVEYISRSDGKGAYRWVIHHAKETGRKAPRRSGKKATASSSSKKVKKSVTRQKSKRYIIMPAMHTPATVLNGWPNATNSRTNSSHPSSAGVPQHSPLPAAESAQRPDVVTELLEKLAISEHHFAEIVSLSAKSTRVRDEQLIAIDYMLTRLESSNPISAPPSIDQQTWDQFGPETLRRLVPRLKLLRLRLQALQYK